MRDHARPCRFHAVRLHPATHPPALPPARAPQLQHKLADRRPGDVAVVFGDASLALKELGALPRALLRAYYHRARPEGRAG